MKVYVCLEWKKWSFDEIFKGEWRIVKAVKDELSARKWCGNDGYRRYEECELEDL
jgi:hypothetical protein